jgi:predicted kinase
MTRTHPPELLLLVGPPGCGKSSMSKDYETYVYVNQDSQGKGHLDIFNQAVLDRKDIIVDRMNFNKEQRARYVKVAKDAGYLTNIFVIHESFKTCYNRMVKRQNHETIKDEESRLKALNFFFTRYERVSDDEADRVIRTWPENYKNSFPKVVICDLDGTLCNIEHRIHHVRGEGKKNWGKFMQAIPDDKPNEWCVDVLRGLVDKYKIVYCSGRSEDEREKTEAWLAKHGLNAIYDRDHTLHQVPLYMRKSKDSRKDSIVKEILLDFEILTRYEPVFMIDDRKQVCDMWRSRGYIVLQCAEGLF